MAGQQDDVLRDLAARFDTTEELSAWIRQLPQRDDHGAAYDGPKVDACAPPQRLRIAPADPNCVERAATYVAAAELIDPRPERRLATIEVPGGLHTIAVEDGSPVVLDPTVRRNATLAGLFKLGRRRNGAAPATMTPHEAIDWIADLAAEPAVCFEGGLQRVEAGRAAMHALIDGRMIADGHIADVGFVVALADHDARLFGEPGGCVVTAAAGALGAIDDEHLAATTGVRNGHGIRLGHYRVQPNAEVLSRLARVGGRLGYRVGVAAVREKLAALGIAPPVLDTLERELNREGLSLGPLAAPPPMPGTLAAIAPDASLGRWLARRL
ncbi:MAG: hypothetical protein H6708_22335 [Kofleriaceae bacterium]|nr:hypothetical protein [Kofleriaceae bacterium]